MHNRTLNALHPNGVFEQQENDAARYTVNWAGLLDTDTISTSTWTQETSGATVASEANTTTTASARLSGTPGRYLFTNKIVTAAGDTREKQISLIVKDNAAPLEAHYYNVGYR